MSKRERLNINKILGILEKEYPDARLMLNYKNSFELLIATILSAQCTDERVNSVTKTLFKKYPSPKSFADAPLEEIEQEIKPTGFYKNKAKNIKKCSETLVNKFKGKVPDNLDDLTKLPGVGRKTANVLLGNVFKKEAIAVDTHVGRVAFRLGLSSATDADRIEKDLMSLIPKDAWTHATHLLGFLGRYTCYARKPNCESCKLRNYCQFYLSQQKKES